MSREEKQQAVDKFVEALENEGDMFFTSGDTNLDYDTITKTIEHQGYWAGGYLRYFFDDKLNLLNMEERRFGL